MPYILYEGVILADSRHTARIIAKQLVSAHVASKVEIILCDIIENSSNEIVEYSRAKLTCLTTVPNELNDMCKRIQKENGFAILSNLVVRATVQDESTTISCANWCSNTALHSEIKTNNDNEEVQLHKNESTSLEKEELSCTKPKEKQKRKSRKKTEDLLKQNSDSTAKENLVNATNEKIEPSENEKEEEQPNAQIDIEQPATKKKSFSIPKWAVEQGLSAKDYSALRDWRVAARWGMDYPDYCKASADARKKGIALKKYLESMGKTHNPDIDLSYITLDYINSKRAENNSNLNKDIQNITEW